MAETAIVAAEAGHAAILAAIHAAAMNKGWAEHEMAALVALPAVSGLIHLTAGTPDGFVLAQAAGDEAEILMLAVLPHARRHGSARRLLDRLASDLAQAGIARLFLEVADDNDAARALYEAHGFTVSGRRPGYYAAAHGPPRDALIMARALS